MMPPVSEGKSAEWYDEHYYRNQRLTLGPWHRHLLPDLISECGPETKLVELGCGQAQIPRLLAEHGHLRPENIFGMDQSKEAINFVRRELPGGNFSVQDLYQLEYPKNSFDVCVMLETIEHLEEPLVALARIHSTIKPGGCFYVSFPNYIHLPWFAVRLLAQWTNHPSWIGLQPVDKIYTIFGIKKVLSKAGFVFEKGIGSNYGPPVFHPLETDRITHFLNRAHMWWWSFHPILKFRKPLHP